MAIVVYEKPACTTCRKLAKLLEENGIVLFGPCTSPVPLSKYYRTY